jgi:DHA2 family multidrug resistance protein
VLQALTIRNEAIVHSRLAESVRPDNPAVVAALPDLDFGIVQSVARLDGEVGRQALMVAYSDSFWLMFLACLVVMPAALLIRRQRR